MAKVAIPLPPVPLFDSRGAKRKRVIVVAIILVLFLLNVFQFTWDFFAYPLNEDVVPDEQAAISIGGAVLSARYKKELDTSSFEAFYIPDKKAWYVGDFTYHEERVGGAPRVIIRKRDGKVLEFYSSM